ncbi:MAG: inorganic phosphate transporter, partial [Hydrogenophaga sp.]|nr:inorganic phosphate transporter [Hydrogenophaga sp.]
MTKKSKSRFVSKYQDVLQLGAAVFFLIVVGVYASLTGASTAGLSSSAVWLLIVAASVGAYMAMNIGANDVANNLGPAVGSGAITMGWAILIAAVFEALGAIVAGGEVVGTIKGGIIDAKQITDPSLFAWVMFAALLAGALWLNLATAVGA